MRILGRRTVLTAALLLGLGMAAAQTQPPAAPPATPAPAPAPAPAPTPAPAPAQPATPAPATPAPATPAPATEQAPSASEETTLTIASVAVTLPALPDATLVRSFNTVLGAGAVYRGSVTGAADQIAQAFVEAGFTAVDAPSTATEEAAAGTTDTAAAPAAGTATTDTAATGTAATGTATTDTAATPAAGTATTDTAATTGTPAAAGTGTAATGGGLADLPEGVVRTFERGGQRFELRVYERGGFTVVVVSQIGGTAAPAAPAN